MSLNTRRTALFSPYALDLRSGELRKFGTKVKMGEQAFQILLMLLETPGEMVTREQLRTKLWAHDTFVDFDHGLNSAVQRLRDSLSDSAGNPRWVETIPRRGYRFVGQVEWSDDSLATEALPAPTLAVPEGSADDKAAPSVIAAPSELLGRTWFFSRRVIPFAVAFLVVLLVAAVLIVKRIHAASLVKQPSQIRSLAVLPLENLSGDPAQEYFADGMTDEVITMLAKNPALRVTSRTSVMQYKRVHRPLPDVARELGVDGILEGSVERSGSRVHLNAQLIYAPQDRHVWAESYDHDLNDLNSLQTDLARTIAREVGLTASPDVRPQRRINPEAHDAYMLGKYYWYAEHYDKSKEYFEKAIGLQADYALAWAALADSYFANVVTGATPAELAMAIEKGESAARKAMALDDSLAEAHNTMAAFYYFFVWNWDIAERESARAIELDPGSSQAYHLRAYILSTLHRNDEAVREDRKSIELDPFVRPWALGYALIRARKFDAAVDELRTRSEVQPEDCVVHSMLMDVYRYKGMAEESVQQWEQCLNKERAAELQKIVQRGGLRAAFEWRLNRLRKASVKEYVSPLVLADAYARLGRKEETLRFLEQAYREHVPWLVHIQSEPDFDFVHVDPRYQAIIRKMGLPPAYGEFGDSGN